MTFVEHSLGESEHIYARSNLKLKTRCSVKLSSSLGTIFPFSILFKELDTLVNSATWVARGNGLRISMQLVTNDFTAQHLDRQTLIESLSALFCSAEVLLTSSFHWWVTDHCKSSCGSNSISRHVWPLIQKANAFHFRRVIYVSLCPIFEALSRMEIAFCRPMM